MNNGFMILMLAWWILTGISSIYIEHKDHRRSFQNFHGGKYMCIHFYSFIYLLQWLKIC